MRRSGRARAPRRAARTTCTATSRARRSRARRCRSPGAGRGARRRRSAAPGGVGGVDDRRDVRDRPERVRRAGHGDPAGARPDPLDDRVDRQPAGLAVERGEHHRRAGVVGGEPPRRDVGVVLEPGADDLVARPERAPDAPGERQGERRHVGPNTMPPGSAPSSFATARARRRHHRPGGHARREPPAAVRVGAALRGSRASRVDRGVDHLGAGRTVEASPAVGQPREAIAHERTVAPNALPTRGCRRPPIRSRGRRPRRRTRWWRRSTTRSASRCR